VTGLFPQASLALGLHATATGHFLTIERRLKMHRALFTSLMALTLLLFAAASARADQHYRTAGVQGFFGPPFVFEVVDDDGISHFFIVDEDTLSNRDLGLLYIAGTRFIVISEGDDGTGDFPVHADVMIVYWPREVL
jgi:hypothetical protein